MFYIQRHFCCECVISPLPNYNNLIMFIMFLISTPLLQHMKQLGWDMVMSRMNIKLIASIMWDKIFELHSRPLFYCTNSHCIRYYRILCSWRFQCFRIREFRMENIQEIINQCSCYALNHFQVQSKFILARTFSRE